MDPSAVAELADVILVALGLRVAALVLYQPASSERPRVLVLADELPPPEDRAAFLEQRTPPGSLGDAEIILKTPAEVAAEARRAPLGSGRVLLDRGGIRAAGLTP